jgi:zinc transport system ATP-binding protein
MRAQAAVEVRSLEVVLGGTTVLQDVSLEVAPGAIFGILGPNGGGKSTLLRVLVGLEKARRGSVRVLGQPPGRSREIGYLPQVPAHDPRFPARLRDVVALGLPSRLRRSGRDRIEAVLDQLGLSSIAEAPVSVLSGGQRQRMFLARALVREPRLLLLDEPTLGVDVQAMDTFLHLLEAIRQERELTVLMVSHDFSVITTHADEVVCVAGKVRYLGSPEDLTEERLTETFGVHNLFLEHRH